MGLFNKALVRLNSGLESDFKIDCDALSDEDWECLAFLISKEVSFDSVVGIPSGGSKLAACLQKYSSNAATQTVLIVDDVLTTGGSMERKRLEIYGYGDAEVQLVRGVVVFARGDCPDWIKPMFKLWDK